MSAEASKLLPDDSPKLAAAMRNYAAASASSDGGPASGAYIAVTVAAPPPGLAPPERKLITGFTSAADLRAAVDASSYIPLWSGGSVTTECAFFVCCGVSSSLSSFGERQGDWF